MMEFQSETLTDEELATITGYQIPSKQIQWLTDNHWEHVLTGARRPIVGRVYARMNWRASHPQRSIQRPKPGHSTWRM